eukprot:COSAG04_NODE_4137_length_2277_cov_5.821314_2_plen_83_part_00
MPIHSLWHRHTDLSAQHEPPAASLLLAKEVAAVGGDTIFADMYAAYESLPEETKRRVASLRAVHKHNPATVQLIQEVATVMR